MPKTYAGSKMERKDLLEILNGDIARIDFVNSSDVALYEMQIFVMPDHVRKMLLDYLAHKVDAKDLTKWACFICGRAEYCSATALDDKFADYYEDMFYVIQRLSTPEIDGAISRDRVETYLSELKKYPAN